MIPLMTTTNLIYLIVTLVFLCGMVIYAVRGMKKRRESGLPDSEPLLAHDTEEEAEEEDAAGAHRA